MDRKQVGEYIWFGTGVRYVQDVGEGQGIHGDGMVAENLREVLDSMESLGLPVARRVATQVDLPDVLTALDAAGEDATITADMASSLRDGMRQVWTAVMGEGAGIEVYVPTAKRFDVTKLLDGVADLLAPNVFAGLPPIVRYDLQEAGKCIAFERPTAAAFHTMRAIEGTLRDFYRAWVKQKRLKVPMWGPMVKQIRERKKRPPDSLLDQLDSIRAHFRNPTQHPEAVYDVYEAEELFSGALDVIARMCRERPSS